MKPGAHVFQKFSRARGSSSGTGSKDQIVRLFALGVERSVNCTQGGEGAISWTEGGHCLVAFEKLNKRSAASRCAVMAWYQQCGGRAYRVGVLGKSGTLPIGPLLKYMHAGGLLLRQPAVLVGFPMIARRLLDADIAVPVRVTGKQQPKRNKSPVPGLSRVTSWCVC